MCDVIDSNEYIPSKDRPDIDTHVFSDIPPDRFGGNVSLFSSPSSSNHRHLHQDNGHAVVLDVTEKGGLPWRRCKRCDMMVPPRCHHCMFCQRCMLRRDHHCFLVGCCIGHWNQRYFVVLMALGMVSSYLAAYLTITYLRHHHGHDDTLWNYFLPYTALQASDVFLINFFKESEGLLDCGGGGTGLSDWWKRMKACWIVVEEAQV